ncbi:MAG: UbiA family prenyltransferase [Planctomycetota bacterium]|jgi:4-hydroxybenzoate polyprenyltransferase
MTASVFVRFLRPVTLAAPITGVVGGAIAAAGGAPPDSVGFACAIGSAILLTGASNGINQVADVETDRINRPDRPLPSGAVTLGQAWAIVAALSVASLALAWRTGPAFLACVAATLPVTAAYSLPPLRTKRVPFLANATIALPRGLLLVVAGWAAGGGATRIEAWVLGALAFVYIFGAASTKDFGDVEGDRATGCKTLPIIWGAKPAARFVAPFLVAPFLLYPVGAALGLLPGRLIHWTVLGVALAAPGARAALLLVRDPTPPNDGSPHPAWGLMYLQLAAAPLGAAVIISMEGPPD